MRPRRGAVFVSGHGAGERSPRHASMPARGIDESPQQNACPTKTNGRPGVSCTSVTWELPRPRMKPVRRAQAPIRVTRTSSPGSLTCSFSGLRFQRALTWSTSRTTRPTSGRCRKSRTEHFYSVGAALTLSGAQRQQLSTTFSTSRTEPIDARHARCAVILAGPQNDLDPGFGAFVFDSEEWASIGLSDKLPPKAVSQLQREATALTNASLLADGSLADR
jgi:hypothetical protein